MDILEIDGIEELHKAADKIIELSGKSGVVALYGTMGAGKTTLIKQICERLGVEDNVTSPTFALVNHYCDSKGNDIYHFDFYRIDRVEEAFDMGYEEYFYSGALCLVEWPEKIEQLLPCDTLKVTIDILGDKERRITITN